MTGTETELQRIERELQILRARYALFEKWAKITKVFFAVVIPLSVVLLLVWILRSFPGDPIPALFFIGMLTFVAAIIWLSWSPPNKEGPRHWLDSGRMIDLVSPQPYPVDFFFPWYRRNTGPFSKAQEIERMIAEREQRLAEIREARP